MKDISIITDDVFRSLVREIRASQDSRTRAMILEKMLVSEAERLGFPGCFSRRPGIFWNAVRILLAGQIIQGKVLLGNR